MTLLAAGMVVVIAAVALLSGGYQSWHWFFALLIAASLLAVVVVELRRGVRVRDERVRRMRRIAHTEWLRSIDREAQTRSEK